MKKREISRINMYILLIVLAMFAIPCIYYLVSKICFVCTIDNSIQSISKGLESENRKKLEKSYEEDYIVNSEGTYKKNDIKKDEILKREHLLEYSEETFDTKYINKESTNIVIARAKNVRGKVEEKKPEENMGSNRSIYTESDLEILGQIKGDIKEKSIKFKMFTGIVPIEEFRKIKGKPELSGEDNPKYKYVEEKDSEQKVFLEEGKVYLFFLKYDNNEKVYDIGYPDACIREIKSISKRKLVEEIEKYNGSGKISDEIEVRKIKEEGYEKLNSIF
jgi:hypothetical protein